MDVVSALWIVRSASTLTVRATPVIYPPARAQEIVGRRGGNHFTFMKPGRKRIAGPNEEDPQGRLGLGLPRRDGVFLEEHLPGLYIKPVPGLVDLDHKRRIR